MPNWKKLIVSGSDASLNSLNLSSVVNAGTDTDKFLVLDSSGNVDFRTGANVLSDIGGQASGNYVTDEGGATGEVAVWSSGTAISGSNSLFFDTVNNRLSIGNSGSLSSLSLPAGGGCQIGWDGTSNVRAFIKHTRSGNKTQLSFGTTTNANAALERVRIDEDGNLGIGTTSPDEALTVEGNISGSGCIQIGTEHVNSGALSSIVGGTLNTNLGACGFIGGGSTNIINASLAFLGGGVRNHVCKNYGVIGGGYENRIIGSSGHYGVIAGGRENHVCNIYGGILGGHDNTVSHNCSFIVGANLTSDKACYTFMNNLDVEGTVSASIFSGSFVGDGSNLTGVGGNPGGSDTQVQYNNGGSFAGSSNLTFDGTNLTVGGNITSSGNIALSGNIVDTDTNESIEIGANDVWFEGKHTHARFGVWARSTSNGQRTMGIDGGSTFMALYTNSTEKVRIDTDGKVGIGTTSPDEALTVVGNISASGEIQTNNNFIVDSNGRVGINTLSPDYKLDVSGNAGINEYLYHNGDTDTYLRYQNNQVDIAAGGQVASLTTTELTLPGSLTVGGTVTAQEFHTEFVSASIVFQSGSTKFGDTTDDIHSFTGSLNVTGSLGVTGNLTISAGHIETDQIYLADKILHSGDSDTYIAFENNTHRYFAAGEEMIKFNSSLITLNEAGGNNDIRIKGNSDTNLFYSDGSADKIGIGTITPDEKLTVEGNISASGNFIGADITGSSLNLSSVVNAGTDTDKFLVLDSDGNVDFRTGANVLTDIGGQASGNYVTDAGGAVCQVAVWSSGTAISGSNDLFFNTNNNSLGIGTATPDSNLHVAGEINATGGDGYRIDSKPWACFGSNLLTLGDFDGEGYETRIMDSDSNEALRVTSGKKVGIGTTTPSVSLEVAGSDNTLLYLSSSTANVYLRLDDNTSTNGNFIGATGNEMHFWTNNTRAATIDGSQCVGIGTTSPAEKLTVAGNISGSGCIQIGTGHVNSGALSSIAGGTLNTILGACGFIGGGCLNTICSGEVNAVIGGGKNNLVDGDCSSILGGINNCICTYNSAIAGGCNNLICGNFSFIGSGQENIICSATNFSVIAGGCRNKMLACIGNTIGGGIFNCICTFQYGTGNTVAGGQFNIISGSNSESGDVIAGGCCNSILSGACCSTIGGGFRNKITSDIVTIAGGTQNTGSVLNGFIGGGELNNLASGESGVIVGGSRNTLIVDSDYAFLGGGNCNIITNDSTNSVLVGGTNNQVDDSEKGLIVGGNSNRLDSAVAAVVVGGCLNTGSGACSGILGGKNNYVNHANSMIIGSDLTSDKACYTFMNNLDVEGTVSGSVFSGSFVGDGSGLTGISGGGSIDGSGAANKLAIWSDSDTLTSDTCLHWDTSNNRLGIGVTSPSCTLHVGGSILACSNLFTEVAVDQTDSGKIRMGVSSTTAEGFIMVRNDGAGHVAADPEFKILFNDSEKFRFDNTGLGIGVTSPAANLDVSGSSVSGKSLQLRSGDVNTGTDSAQILFAFNGNSWNSTGYAHSIRTRHNSTSTSCNAIDFYTWTPSDSANVLGTKRVMTIDGPGYVGINCTSRQAVFGCEPSLRVASGSGQPGVLDIHGIGQSSDGDLVGLLQFSNSSDSNYTIGQIIGEQAGSGGSGNSGGGHLVFKTNGGGSGVSPSERMRITSAGNVNIGDINYAYGGTNYHIKFGEDSGDTYISNVNGTAFMSAGGYYYGAACRQLTDGNTAYVATRLDPAGDFHIESLTGATANGNNNTATCKFTVKGSGNVGIGTSSPDQALHVSGRGLFDTGASTPDSTTGTYEKGITLTGGNMRLVMDTSNVTNGGSYIQTRHQSTSFPNAYYRLHLNPLGGGVGINAGTLAPTGSLHVEGPAYIKGGTIDVGDSVSNAGIVMDCNTCILGRFNGQYLRNIISTDNANNIRIGQSGTSLIHEINLQPGTTGGCVRIYDNSTEYARFTNSKFGIGTTDPQATLHADYGSTVAPSLTFGATAGQILQNENSEFAFGLHNASPYPLWIQGRNSGNSARNITLQPLGGNIGIGTYSPSSLLDVDGTTTTVTLVETSTKELKEDIQPLDSQLENLKKLKPIEFAWKKNKKKDFGLLAEDVEKVYPYLVEHDEEDKLIGVKYSKLTSVLVKALQEQQEQIDELKEEIKVLKQK